MSDLASQLRPYEVAARALEGWRLEFEPEAIDGDIPWNYEELATMLAAQSESVIDLGTGGGETFLAIIDGRRSDTFATEEWDRNAPVAAKRLHGIAVVTRCSSVSLPFRAQSFDLVLSRHEAIEPIEVARVLKPGGKFFSQQVIHDFMFELAEVFPGMHKFPNFFEDYQERFLQLGLHLRRTEAFRYKIRFHELGHLVYQLVATPWTIPGFSVDSHIEGLSQLNEKLSGNNSLEYTAGYYLLEVEKENSPT